LLCARLSLRLISLQGALQPMSGWDKDTSGDYTPRPPPRWFWLAAGAAVFLILILSLRA
jgi:hypothetical protein